MKGLLFAILTLIVLCHPAAAQFSIAPERPMEVTRYTSDSMRKVVARRYDYTTRARERAERRRLRNQRNTTEFEGGLFASQTQFENWFAGGQNTLSARSTIFFRHQYLRDPIVLDTKFESRYGMNLIDKKPFKNEDEFKLNFMALYRFKSDWSLAAQLNLRSQWANGYSTRIDNTRRSSFMSPGYTDAALGINYRRGTSPLSITLNPFGWSLTTVIDPTLSARGVFGVPKGDRYKGYIGPSGRIDLDMTFYKKVFRLRSYFYTFASFSYPPMVRWETTFDIRATKFLTTTIYAMLYYDRQSSAPHPSHIQFNSSLSVGLSYKFKNKK